MTTEADDDAKGCLNEQEDLARTRLDFEPQVEDLRRACFPSAKGINDDLETGGRKGTDDMFDSTLQDAVMKLTFGIITQVCPPGELYQTLGPDGFDLKNDEAAKQWFDLEARELMDDRYAPTSGFQTENFQTVSSGVALGQGYTFVDPNPDGGCLYSHVPWKQGYIADDNFGRALLFHRRYKRTALAIAKMADRNPDFILPEKIEKCAEKTPNEMFWLLHCVRENNERKPRLADYRGMKWSSYLVCEEVRATMSRGGYRTFPYAPLRFWRNAGEPYARGPMHNALADWKTVNAMQRSHIRHAERVLDPVLLTVGDGMMSKVRLRPNSLVHGALSPQGHQLVQAMEMGGMPQLAEALIEKKQIAIKDTTLVNLLTQITNSPKLNQMQIIEIMKERAAVFGPSFGTWQEEYFGTMTEREEDIRAAQGRQVPLPDTLVGRKYKTIYQSPLNRAQRAGEASSIMQAFETALPIMQAYPDTTHEINAVKSVRTVFESFGAEQALNDSGTAQKMRAVAQQQQQAASMAEAAPKVASAALDAAKAQETASAA